MKVIVAENCGFCPGVRNAISMAEKILSVEKEGK
jgi:4-hydroxy-3-methylbut-2-enyl diphosphate reductase IspH